MRAEPPDRLTAQVWQMLADARTSPLSLDEVIEELTLSLRRDAAYLARRERRGHQTAYDEVMERSLAARARAIVLLQTETGGDTTENGGPRRNPLKREAVSPAVPLASAEEDV